MAKIAIPPSTEPHNPIRTAYWAGIIDGEAHVGIGKGVYTRKDGTRTPMPVISVAMCHKPTVLACASYFSCGGSLTMRHRKKKNHQPIYEWKIAWQKARFVAEMVRPYSITRAADLDKIIELPVTPHGPKGKLTDIQIREMRTLHYNGMNCVDLAKLFMVHPQTIWLACTYKSYKHIK